MDDIASVLTDAGKLIEDHAWLPLASLVIYVLTRLIKDDKFVAWFPVTIAPRYRSWVAVGLGVISGVLQALVGGAKWPTAIIGGLVSAYTAIAGHDLVVESIRKGRDIGIPKDEHVDPGPPGGPVVLGAKKSGRPPPAPPYSTPFRIFSLAMVAMLLAIGCESCTKNGHDPVNWPKVVSCVNDPLEIAGDVGDVLVNDYGGKELSPSGRSKLEELAWKKGTPAVLCIVDMLVRQWVSPAAAPDPNRLAGAERGERFLKSVGTKIERN